MPKTLSKLVNAGIFASEFDSTGVNGMGNVLQSNGVYNRSDIQWYTKFKRFGCIDPYNSITTTREYLFFTKPDLHLFSAGTNNLNPQITNQPYFLEVNNRYKSVMYQLQISSAGGKNYPFMNILSNSVKNTLDLNDTTTTEMESATNIYGTSITYRGSGYNSDEDVEFSLEFEDTRYLEIYNLFKIYEEYERLKRLGIVTPPAVGAGHTSANGYTFNRYVKNKELHDQFSIFKFIVDEDAETLLYYAKLIGVYPKNLPRSSFSEMKADGGLTYSIEFKAAFIDDMNPEIITDFNYIVNSGNNVTNVPIYNSSTNSIDGRWCKTPYIVRSNKSTNWLGPNDMKYSYKLKWGV